MEIYYTRKVEGKTGACAAWSRAPGYPALLAVALGHNAVGIFTDEGRPLEPSKPNLIVNVRSTECLKLCWHPLLPLLAIGWKDGAVSFWNAEERHMEEDSKTHRTSIVALSWTQNGERLMSVDDNGKLSIWKTDRLYRPIHVVSYEEQPGNKVKLLCQGPVGPSPESNSLACTVFYSVNTGGKTIIKWANDQGYMGIVQEMSEEVSSLLWYPEKEQVIAVGVSCSLYILNRDETQGTWIVLSKMKFAAAAAAAGGGNDQSGPAGGNAAAKMSVCWAAPHTLATASDRDSVVRMYNFDTEDNYVLQLDSSQGDVSGTARICCLASDLRFGLLAAGTDKGSVTVFKHTVAGGGGISDDVDPNLDLAKTWEDLPAFSVGSSQTQLEWGPHPRLMLVACGAEGVHVCRQTQLKQCLRDGLVVMQTGVDRLLLEHLDTAGKQAPEKLQLPMQILGLDYSRGSLLIYDGSQAQVFKVADNNQAALAGSFECVSKAMAINNDSIFKAAEGKLEVCNLSGTVKQTLVFDDASGGNNGPSLLDCNRDYLASVTPSHSLRVYKVAGREARPHQGPGIMLPPELNGPGLTVDQLRVNSSGTMVAALCSSAERSREPCLYVHCFENQTTLVYDFSKDQRVPQSVAWDVVESKLLAVQTLSIIQSGDDGLEEHTVSHEVALCFVSADHGVLLQEYQCLGDSGAKGFVGLQAPHLILNKPSAASGSGTGASFTSHVAKELMKSFAGLSENDDVTKTALLDFSYHLATGNMDEAFRAVKAIKNPAVWENMAHTCIKNKRLDVAEHCLGNMEHTRAARALRLAKNIEELDARVGTVAVHLNMMEDAKKLFISAERYDLLNKLYQACGQWDKALEVAEKNDRIHLKATHYAYAQNLEKVADFKSAQQHYEAAGCSVVEVTRMLHQAGKTAELEQYVSSQPDVRDLTLWWAKYCESQGEVDKALACYEKAGDTLSVVRLHCATGDVQQAEEQVVRLGDPAAAFHLARQYENQGRIPEAIRFYTQAHRYSHGVRLAKGHGLDSELVNLALKSTPGVMIDAADYLNEKGEHERAALLYMKGGKLSKAVDMCFHAQLFDVLQHIADDLGSSGADPATYGRCADFFMQHGHNDKAVKMLIAAGQYSRALEMCVEHDVQLTEDMAESMTPGKDALPPDERTLVLTRIAKLAKRQGQWQIAAKKFTQAGDKVKAMKALLRSGDTEKIVFFAGVSRQKDLYLMAANYLQTLDWHSDPELMKHIVNFYTKAAAVDNLAVFYEACAQIEIDEYRDYEKALQATREAFKYAQKSKSEERDYRVNQVQNRLAAIEKFVTARSLFGSNAQAALSVCSELLMILADNAEQEGGGIRIGDVYAVMVEYWYQQGNALEAYKVIDQMQSRGILVGPFLEQKMVDEIYKTLGVQPIVGAAQQMPTGSAAQVFDSAGGYVDDEEIVADDQDFERFS